LPGGRTKENQKAKGKGQKAKMKGRKKAIEDKGQQRKNDAGQWRMNS
jgi:hypothetical protein